MTQQEIERLRELKLSGMSDREIGEKIGYTRRTIMKTRKKNGILVTNRTGTPSRMFYIRKDGEVVDKGSAKQLADKYGLSVYAIYSACRAGKWRGMIVESERIVRKGCD